MVVGSSEGLSASFFFGFGNFKSADHGFVLGVVEHS